MDFPQRVLIVDDDPIQRAVLEQIFITHGSPDVEAGADGLDAISVIENSTEPFDLIVLDLVMPEYDGIRLISYLESQNVKTRLLLLSGLPNDVVRMSNTLAGASGLTSIGSLQKPLHLQSLLAIVHDQRWPRRKAQKRKLITSRSLGACNPVQGAPGPISNTRWLCFPRLQVSQWHPVEMRIDV